MRRLRPLLGTAGLLLLLSGCGSRTQPVEGLVEWPEGAPATQLAGYMVTFQAEGEPVSASGRIQPDGTFRVGTFEEGDGAVLGRHRVAINPPVPTGDGPVVRSRIRAKRERLEISELEVTIVAGKNRVVLRVEPAEW